MNQGLPTYSNFVTNGNRQISAKYVVNNFGCVWFLILPRRGGSGISTII